jgi:aminopeptidase N
VIGGFEGFSGMEYPTFVLTEPAALPAVHETAHQWWYGLVGNNEYRNPWMDEALTQYTTTKLLGVPEYCADAPFWFDDGMRIDAGMDYYASHADFYAPGIYGDGACMFIELEGLIGSDAMRTALRQYLAENRFKLAEPSTLRAAFQAATPIDLTPFWERWRNTAA